MKTIFEVPTRGDAMTMPGGIALRCRENGTEFVVHNYNTDRETITERHYWQGSYFSSGSNAECFAKALEEFARRVSRATGYDRGGALDIGTLLDYPAVPGFVDASGALDMAQALND
jgi:hypothetical protein